MNIVGIIQNNTLPVKKKVENERKFALSVNKTCSKSIWWKNLINEKVRPLGDSKDNLLTAEAALNK